MVSKGSLDLIWTRHIARDMKLSGGWQGHSIVSNQDCEEPDQGTDHVGGHLEAWEDWPRRTIGIMARHVVMGHGAQLRTGHLGLEMDAVGVDDWRDGGRRRRRRRGAQFVRRVNRRCRGLLGCHAELVDQRRERCAKASLTMDHRPPIIAIRLRRLVIESAKAIYGDLCCGGGSRCRSRCRGRRSGR
jgi:hypothetical protein